MRPWSDHLDADDRLLSDAGPGAAGLGAAGTLLHLWAGRAQEAPSAPLWFEGGRRWTAGEFDEATRTVACLLYTSPSPRD